jgi:peptidoglycan hydrolase CwlO-like protein
MKKMYSVFLSFVVIVGLMMLAGCSNNATDEQLAQLQQLQKENSALEQQISDKQKQKDDIQRQIADQNDKLKQCQQDTQDAQKALGK